MTVPYSYSLGRSAAELARLDAQAASIARPTSMFLGLSGIARGMRVLDLGTGLGHVALLLRDLVGPGGEVIGIDGSASTLAVAEQRRAAAGADNVRFLEADVRTFRDAKPFDAVVGRLILFHLADPLEVLHHHLSGLAGDGVMVMIDFDIGSARSEPPVPLFDEAKGWVMAAFRHAGAHPTIGTQLGRLLCEAGLTDVDGFGVQWYLSSDDPAGSVLLASVVKSLAPVILNAGLATEQDLGLETLEERLAREAHNDSTVQLIPAVAGAWGRKRSEA